MEEHTSCSISFIVSIETIVSETILMCRSAWSGTHGVLTSASWGLIVHVSVNIPSTTCIFYFIAKGSGLKTYIQIQLYIFSNIYIIYIHVHRYTYTNAYMFVITYIIYVIEKVVMTLKEIWKGYMKVFGGRKGKWKCYNWIKLSK